jgi:hypothetical protein
VRPRADQLLRILDVVGIASWPRLLEWYIDDMSSSDYTPFVAAIVPVVVVGAFIVATLVARRRGYNVGGNNVVVRCREGHLFTTIWIPGVSFKALRFGGVRLQRCPVGNHVTFVTPVRDSDLTYEERRFAQEHHDNWIP